MKYVTTHLNIVKILLENRADVKAKRKNGRTPLHEASSRGYLGIVETFLENNANLKAKDKYGNTPISLASKNKHSKVVKKLQEWRDLKYVNGLFNTFNETNLEFLFKSKNRDKYLFQIKNSEGKSIYNRIICSNKHSTTFQKYLKKFKLYSQEVQDDKPLFELLLKNNVNPDEKDKNELTALVQAISKGNLDVVKALIDCKADVNLKDERNMTALHHAAERGHLEIVKVLVGNNALVDSKALEKAKINGHSEIEKFLCEFILN